MFAKKAISRVFSVLFVLAFILALVGSAHATPASLAEPANTIETPSLLQFTAGGHILGFSSSGVYAATGSHALHVDFMGANSVQPQAESPSAEGKAAPLSRVEYPNLWQGISLIYDAPSGGILRSTYQLEAGANVRAIRLRYNAPLTVNSDGSLTIAFETDTLNESAPIAWQVIKGRQVPVAVSFTQHNSEVGFALGQYDPRYPLTIDPMLTWNTFLGGSSTDDGGHALAVDEDGNIYVGGTSTAAWSCSPTPCTARPFSGGWDGFVAKLDSSGALQWNTFLGSSGYVELTFGLTLDNSDNVYVTGWSTWEWSGAGSGAYVAKLNSTDGALQWATFFERSIGSAIAVDDSGDVYVAGQSFGGWGCASPINCTVRPYTSGGASQYDGFVAKLNPSGVLLWNTFLGGVKDDWGNAIEVDGSGNIYVAGGSEATWGAPVRPYNPGDGIAISRDTFAAKLDSNGALQWNTFLGGSGDEGASMIYQDFRGIAVDEDGNVYVVGESSSEWSCAPVACTVRAFTTDDIFQRDAFVAKMDSNGGLEWNTFLGGHGEDDGCDIAVDGNGNVYVTGSSPDTWGSPFPTFTEGDDAFAVKLNSSGAIQWSAFLGGDGYDQGNGIVVDDSGNVHVAGTTEYVTWGAPVRPYNYSDVFVAKITNVANNQLTFKSVSTQDGWILESSENSNKGGTLDKTATTFRLGDDKTKKQYRGILSFKTSGLPDNAVITKVTLKVKKQGITGGGNPVTTFQGFMADIKKGIFGTAALQTSDFQTAASKSYGPFMTALGGGWYSIDLTSGKAYINKLATNSGLTQIRLRFKLDDNNNAAANYLSLYSGDAGAASRPKLIIEYYVP